MGETNDGSAETVRLEGLWSGEFGDAYVDRNRNSGRSRELFWREIHRACAFESVLEIGCNVGANLTCLAQLVRPTALTGVDINAKALRELRLSIPDVNALWAPGRELPFRDRWFDLSFTIGVLIHQPESTLPLVMAEIVRCSRQFVLCGEYFAEGTIEVPYRGESGALFKRDYGRLYSELFPELRLMRRGFLGRDDGWDDVTYWLFERVR